MEGLQFAILRVGRNTSFRPYEPNMSVTVWLADPLTLAITHIYIPIVIK
jgi:hypothetical protein